MWWGVPSLRTVSSLLLGKSSGGGGESLFSGVIVRHASKKASGGGNKNPKQAKGNNKGIHYWDGQRVYDNDIIVHKQTKLWFHPGLNVRLAGRNNIVARKEGTVRFTVETTDLNWSHNLVEKYYSTRSRDVPFFKKYVHVIPDTQHTRFKHVGSV